MRARADGAGGRRPRGAGPAVRLAAGVVLILALLLGSGLAALAVHARAQDEASRDAEARLAQARERVQAEFRQVRMLLQTAAATEEGTGSAEPPAFDSIAAALLDHPLVSAVGWAPLVTQAQRASGDPAAVRIRQGVGAGLSLGRATARERYFPVAAWQPQSFGWAGGFDLGSTALTREVLEQAERSGAARVGGPLDVPVLGRLLVVAQPVFRPGADLASPAQREAALAGFLGTVLRPDRLAEVAGLPASQLALRSDDGGLVAGAADLVPGASAPIDLLGQRWTLGVAEDPPSALLPLAIALSGAVLAALLGILFALVAGRERRAMLAQRRMVDTLKEHGDALEHESARLAEANRRLSEAAKTDAILQDVLQAVASGSAPEAVAGRVVDVALALTGATAAVALRRMDSGWEVMRSAGPGAGGLAEAARVPGGAADLAVHRGIVRVAAADEVPGAAGLGGIGADAVLAAPARTRQGAWGVIATAHRRGTGDLVHEGQLGRLADLLGLAAANAEARAALVAQASTDGLTGLANHRTFQERLTAEVARARRHDRPLSLIVVDVDNFKAVNDAGGHQGGDAVLRGVAELLRAESRRGDVVARIGGDEFAWLVPETDGLEAWRSAEALRERVRAARHLLDGARVTVSCGVCDLADASDEEELLRFADGALYWSKHHGRDCSFRYSPEVVEPLSDAEQAEMLRRRQTLTSLRILARAVDAKDPSTLEHSERVAALAELIGLELGWSPDEAARLREAAMVHDVGKIAVPDAILLKPGPLTRTERDLMRAHAAVGAEIVAEALAPDQVSWVRFHHERMDGTGYPDSLPGSRIPLGARILALADAWDVMTSARPYRGPLDPDEALAEIHRSAGTQFWRPAVGALARLIALGRVGPGADSGIPVREPAQED